MAEKFYIGKTQGSQQSGSRPGNSGDNADMPDHETGGQSGEIVSSHRTHTGGGNVHLHTVHKKHGGGHEVRDHGEMSHQEAQDAEASLMGGDGEQGEV